MKSRFFNVIVMMALVVSLFAAPAIAGGGGSDAALEFIQRLLNENGQVEIAGCQWAKGNLDIQIPENVICPDSSYANVYFYLDKCDENNCWQQKIGEGALSHEDVGYILWLTGFEVPDGQAYNWLDLGNPFASGIAEIRIGKPDNYQVVPNPAP
jgi:hypothetical protein